MENICPDVKKTVSQEFKELEKIYQPHFKTVKEGIC